MKIRALCSFAGCGFSGHKGMELDVPENVAKDLINAAFAKEAEERQAETAEETAAKDEEVKKDEAVKPPAAEKKSGKKTGKDK